MTVALKSACSSAMCDAPLKSAPNLPFLPFPLFPEQYLLGYTQRRTKIGGLNPVMCDGSSDLVEQRAPASTPRACREKARSKTETVAAVQVAKAILGNSVNFHQPQPIHVHISAFPLSISSPVLELASCQSRDTMPTSKR